MILVTGASGLLGFNFVLAAQQRHRSLVAVYHQHPIHMPGVRTVQADLTDSTIVDDLVNALQPEWVVHCAALTDVDLCQEHPQEARRINVDLSRNLAAAARRGGARFAYISTDSVFDGEKGNYAEEDATRPLNVYAESKLEGEAAAQGELDSSLIIRTNIYGWNVQEKLSLAEWVLSRLESDLPVPGFHDVVFTPILASHLSEIILDMMEQGLDGLYHVAGSQPCTKYEFALQLADVFGLDRQLIQPVSIGSSALRAPRPRNTSLDTAKVSRVLKTQLPDVESGLQRFKALRDSGFVAKLKGCT